MDASSLNAELAAGAVHVLGNIQQTGIGATIKDFLIVQQESQRVLFHIFIDAFRLINHTFV